MAPSSFRQGVEAVNWTVHRRGLGGGSQYDGIAWQMALEELWEGYVEGIIRRESRLIGAEVLVGRRRETTLPIEWSDPYLRSMGSFVPDIVARRGRQIQIVDAKYKSHYSEIASQPWHLVDEATRESHRADLHQVLAYAALADADDVAATLVYPVRIDTWESMRARDRHISTADVALGARRVRLVLRALPFGSETPIPLDRASPPFN